jgi:hypothetical protein
MGLNAISEFGERDADVTRISRIAARSQRNILRRVLEKAKERAEMDPEADIDSAVDFLECTFAGIRMAAKAGKSQGRFVRPRSSREKHSGVDIPREN